MKEARPFLACHIAALADAALAPSDVDAMVRFDLETTQDIELARNLGVGNLRFFAELQGLRGARLKERIPLRRRWLRFAFDVV